MRHPGADAPEPAGYDERFDDSLGLTSALKLRRDLRKIRGVRSPGMAGGLIKKAFRRFGRFLHFHQENEIVMFDLRRPLPGLPERDGLVLRRMTADDLDCLRSMADADTVNVFRKRLSKATGVIAFVGCEPAGYGWMTQFPRWGEGTSGFSYAVIPKPGFAYLFDLFVHPRFRGRGVGVQLIRKRLELAAEAGAKTAFFIYERDNRSMVAVARRLGLQSGGRIRHRNVLWFRKDDLVALWRFSFPAKERRLAGRGVFARREHEDSLGQERGLRVIRSVPEFAAFGKRWREAVERIPEANCFLSYEWLSPWLTAFLGGREVYFIAVEEQSDILGLAPFLVHHRERKVTLPVNTHVGRAGLAIRNETTGVVSLILQNIRENFRGYKIVFPRLDVRDRITGLIREVMRALGYIEMPCKDLTSPLIVISGDWESYLNGLAKHVRNELKRKVKKFHGAGSVELKRVTDSGEVEEAFLDILEVEKKTWRYTSKKSAFPEEDLTAFLKPLSLELAKSGMLILYLLYLDGKPVAYVYGIIWKRALHMLMTGFDDGMRKLSPGTNVIFQALQDAFRMKLESVDFLGADYRWKMEYSSELRDHVQLTFVPRRLASGLRRYCGSIAMRYVKRTWPGFWEKAREIRRKGR